MSVRESLELGADEIHDLVKRCLLFGFAMAPERSEPRTSVHRIDEPEQILESAVEQRIPLHIKEQIPRIGLRQPRKALPRYRIKNFVAVFPVRALRHLQCRLCPNPLEDFRLHAANALSGRRTGESRHGVDTDIGQFSSLAFGYTRYEAQMVGLLPL